jgi:uncharacterized Zn finger protein
VSKHYFNFILSEMTALRVVCSSCGSAVEATIRQINTTTDVRCPCCGTVFRNGSQAHEDAFTKFAVAVRELEKLNNGVVQFNIEEKGTP